MSKKNLHGILAIDPGVTTGVARAVVDLSEGMVAECFSGALEKESWEVVGDEGEQGLLLANAVAAFVHDLSGYSYSSRAAGGMVTPDWSLVIEDWVPRLPLKSGKREVFYPVRVPQRMLGRLEESGLFEGGGVAWQLASPAKRFATDARLRKWGVWVRGSDHQRDAWRHVASRLNVLLG
jgi:hypothetical protein